MKIAQIKRMWWGDEKHTLVGLIADTEDEGLDLTIGTPYNDTSIIWEAVRAYPSELIEAYVPPVEDVDANAAAS